MYMANAKILRLGPIYSIGSRWGIALGVTQILAFLDTNMFVYPTQNAHVGGSYPTRGVLRCSGI